MDFERTAQETGMPETGTTIVARDVDGLVAAVARAQGDVVVHIPHDLSPLIARIVRATIEGLAIDHAPLRRITAIAPDHTADPADVAAAIGYLAGATSTTGQILSISGRTAPVAG